MSGQAQNFTRDLFAKLRYHLESPDCRYADNSYEYYLLGSEEAVKQDAEWLSKHSIPAYHDFLEHSEKLITRHVTEKKFLYGLLADSKSRELLLTVTAYCILSRVLVRMPYYVEGFRDKLAELNGRYKCQDDSEIAQKIASGYFDVSRSVALYDLGFLGLPGRGYCYPGFLIGMKEYGIYQYKNEVLGIKVEPGDYVFDCGSAFGDNALLFSYMAGKGGKVFSFEPHPRIFQLLEHNISINPELGGGVTPINRAVSDKPGEKLGFNLSGTASTTSTTHNHKDQYHMLVETTSVDYEVESRGLNRLDFLKMDIEGAELDALIGATKSLKKFRPKLAISIYHKFGDFKLIPSFIHKLNLGYEFYFDHHSVNEWESVLYAIAK